MPRFGQQLQVKRIAALNSHRVNQGCQGGKVHALRVVWAGAKFAVKVPKVNAFGQCLAALTFHVLANFVFGGLKHTVTVFAFNRQLECFFHEIL